MPPLTAKSKFAISQIFRKNSSTATATLQNALPREPPQPPQSTSSLPTHLNSLAQNDLEESSSLPTHLVVLIHGVNGFASDCEYIGREIRKANAGRNIYIAAPTVNQGLSHDGILLGSKRYVRWIKTHIKRNPSITQLSIIGHSLGGLYARCIVGLLWKDNVLAPKGKLKGHTLITLATPHLPPRQWDHLFGRKFGAWMLQALIGKSGKDLLLFHHGPRKSRHVSSNNVDGDADTNTSRSLEEDMPILQQMAVSPTYLDPLRNFTRLLTYANVKSDPVINYANAALSPTDLCPKRTEETQGGKNVAKPLVFEHSRVVEDLEKSGFMDDEFAEEGEDKGAYQLKGVKSGMPDLEMMRNLSSLHWKRYGILPSRGVLAHADMVIKFKEMSLKHGAPVISHIASHFTPQELEKIHLQEQMEHSNATTSSAETTCVDEATTSTWSSPKVGDEYEFADGKELALQSLMDPEADNDVADQPPNELLIPEKRSLLFNE